MSTHRYILPAPFKAGDNVVMVKNCDRCGGSRGCTVGGPRKGIVIDLIKERELVYLHDNDRIPVRFSSDSWCDVDADCLSIANPVTAGVRVEILKCKFGTDNHVGQVGVVDYIDKNGDPVVSGFVPGSPMVKFVASSVRLVTASGISDGHNPDVLKVGDHVAHANFTDFPDYEGIVEKIADSKSRFEIRWIKPSKTTLGKYMDHGDLKRIPPVIVDKKSSKDNVAPTSDNINCPVYDGCWHATSRDEKLIKLVDEIKTLKDRNYNQAQALIKVANALGVTDDNTTAFPDKINELKKMLGDFGSLAFDLATKKDDPAGKFCTICGTPYDSSQLVFKPEIPKWFSKDWITPDDCKTCKFLSRFGISCCNKNCCGGDKYQPRISRKQRKAFDLKSKLKVANEYIATQKRTIVHLNARICLEEQNHDEKLTRLRCASIPIACKLDATIQRDMIIRPGCGGMWNAVVTIDLKEPVDLTSAVLFLKKDVKSPCAIGRNA